MMAPRLAALGDSHVSSRIRFFMSLTVWRLANVVAGAHG